MRPVDPLRPEEPGERCTCGRQAVDVLVSERFGDIGHCERDSDGAPAGGWCPFCENKLRHDEPPVDKDGNTVGVVAQGRRCPLYRLRLTDPPPRAGR